MSTTDTTVSLTPFHITAYFRDAVPSAATRGMRGYVLRLLLDMVQYKGENIGRCFPAVGTLAQKAGRSTRHIRRILAELEALGMVQRIIRKAKHGGYTSSIYQLNHLISWVNENVRRGADTDSRKTSYRGKKNPRRGGFFKSKKEKGAQSRPSALADPKALYGAEPWKQYATGQLDFLLMEVPSDFRIKAENEAKTKGIRPFFAKAYALWCWKDCRSGQA